LQICGRTYYLGRHIERILFYNADAKGLHRQEVICFPQIQILLIDVFCTHQVHPRVRYVEDPLCYPPEQVIGEQQVTCGVRPKFLFSF
jgi:hypothetical protein